MARHVICSAGDLASGHRKLVEVAGRAIVIFNVDGNYFALANRCPHQGGSLYHGDVTERILAPRPGKLASSTERDVVRCPWHGWEFDVRTGKAICDPQRIATRRYQASLVRGKDIANCIKDAQSFAADPEGEYVVINL